MISPIHQLGADELMIALDAIDPVDLLVDELVGRAAGGAGRPSYPDGRLTPWRGPTADGRPPEEFSLVQDLREGTRCVHPTAALAAMRTAALTTLAARELVTPGVVTAAVLGSGFAAQPLLTTVARRLPGLSHVAICPGAGDGPIEPLVLDRLDLAGIGLTVTGDVADAVFGATLVVVTAADVGRLEIGQLTRGALVVNMAGADLPDDLVDAVDRIYVDDTALVDCHPQRNVGRLQPAEPDPGPAWSSRPAGRRGRPIDGELGQLLTGVRAGRSHGDDIVLVELLDTAALDVRLACWLQLAALERGLGVRLPQ